MLVANALDKTIAMDLTDAWTYVPGARKLKRSSDIAGCRRGCMLNLVDTTIEKIFAQEKLEARLQKA
ncbi:hypothetical protein QNJ95_37390 [Bradyrhizobium elkanii]|uniref:hypothetical protein n=1 Tax=Bradyrhizobium elkanii TaxID=29448 RepID=UPI002711F017|nr:hypothetical protein [Bradyrhizobium elkanii]WLA38552.1 hypothetical protein QNJ95_37390 [Bradyrhizobium elkanii]